MVKHSAVTPRVCSSNLSGDALKLTVTNCAMASEKTHRPVMYFPLWAAALEIPNMAEVGFKLNNGVLGIRSKADYGCNL